MLALEVLGHDVELGLDPGLVGARGGVDVGQTGEAAVIGHAASVAASAFGFRYRSRVADREALYQQSCAHDDDVDTQLVLADALIDLGDPRGRLLAVQRALELDPWNADLQRDEVRLINRHADAFLGPLALHRYDDGLELTWHRGFVRGAAIDEQHVSSSRLLDELLQIPAVESLSALRLGHVLDFEGCRACLVARRPALRRLEYGIDAHGNAVFEEGTLAPLLEVLPTLEAFVGPSGHLGRIRLPEGALVRPALRLERPVGARRRRVAEPRVAAARG